MHIVIPEEPGPIRSKFTSGDISLVFGSVATVNSRPFLFLSEELTAFVIHTSPWLLPRKRLKKAYFSVQYVSTKSLGNGREVLETSVVGNVLGERLTSVVLENRLEGEVTTLAGEQMYVTIWMFTFVAAAPQDGAERVCLSVSLQKPSTEPHTQPLAQFSKDDSILADIVSNEPLGFAEAVVKDTTSIETLIIPPLLLSVKTSSLGKSGARGKSEYATLRLQVPRLSPFLREDLHVNILSVNATFKSGKVTPISPASSPLVPKRCSADDVYHLTYSLQFHEALPEAPVDPQVNALSNALSFNITVQYEKFNGILYSPITGYLKICWSTLIDLLAPRVQQFNRKSTLVSNTSNHSKSAPHLRPSNGLLSPRLAAGGATISSPSLSVSKPGANLKFKPFRSVALLPASALAVTLNVALPPSSPLSGVQLSFMGSLNIPVGVVQCWKLQVINNGSRTLHLNMHSKRLRKGFPLYTQPNNSSVATSVLSFPNSSKRGEKESKSVRFKTERDIQSQLSLYHHYNSLKQARDGVVVLTSEISLGQLDGGQVYETELNLVGFVKGIHTLDGLRIFDAVSGEGYEIGRLLEVVVV